MSHIHWLRSALFTAALALAWIPAARLAAPTEPLHQLEPVVVSEAPDSAVPAAERA